MKAPWSAVPMLPVAAGLIAGITLWAQSPGPGHGMWEAVICLAAGAAGMFTRWRYWAFGLLCVVAGWLAGGIGRPAPLPREGLQTAVSTAVIQEARRNDRGFTLLLRVNSMQMPDSVASGAEDSFEPFLCQAVCYRGLPQLMPGQVVRYGGAYVPLGPDSADTYMRYLYNIGVRARARRPLDDLSIVGEENTLRYRCARRREHLVGKIVCSRMSDDAQAFMSAVILGDASLMSNDVRTAFRAAGIGHFLALSGLHVGIVAMLLSLALLPVRLLAGRRWQYAAVIVLLWGYAMLTGLGTSVTRACVMGTLVMGGAVLRRPSVPLNALCAAAVVVLMIQPWALFQACFQLSFMAVAGILLFADTLNPFNQHRHRRLWQAAMWLTVPVGAMLGTGVLTAYWFGSFPLYVVAVNVALSWLMPWVLGVGMALLLCLAVGWPCGWLETAADWLYRCIDVPARWAASLPSAQPDVPHPSMLAMMVYYAFLVALWMALRAPRARRVPLRLLCASLLGAFIILA